MNTILQQEEIQGKHIYIIGFDKRDWMVRKNKSKHFYCTFLSTRKTADELHKMIEVIWINLRNPDNLLLTQHQALKRYNELKEAITKTKFKYEKQDYLSAVR